jgi:hypothetical protein
MAGQIVPTTQGLRQTMHGQLAHRPEETFFAGAIRNICDLNWSRIDRAELISVAWAYYHFSVQFRENLEVARDLYPDDGRLLELERGECNTNNLSPWPGVAKPGERMDHDEFMRRTLELMPIADSEEHRLRKIGQSYLATVRSLDRTSRALSIASYEDGGLESVFRSILEAPCWEGTLLQAFKHFLVEHIRFDSDPNAGHGALCRHLTPDDGVLPFWTAFRSMLVQAAPRLAGPR